MPKKPTVRKEVPNVSNITKEVVDATMRKMTPKEVKVITGEPIKEYNDSKK